MARVIFGRRFIPASRMAMFFLFLVFIVITFVISWKVSAVRYLPGSRIIVLLDWICDWKFLAMALM